jgi:hypothetical protein
MYPSNYVHTAEREISKRGRLLGGLFLSGKELCTQAAPAPRACAAPAPRLAQWPPRAAIGGVSHSLLSALRTPPELAPVAPPPICPRCSALARRRRSARAAAACSSPARTPMRRRRSPRCESRAAAPGARAEETRLALGTRGAPRPSRLPLGRGKERRFGLGRDAGWQGDNGSGSCGGMVG